MKESEYIRVRNISCLQTVSLILHDIVPGDEYGVSEVKIKEVEAAIYKILTPLRDNTPLEEG